MTILGRGGDGSPDEAVLGRAISSRRARRKFERTLISSGEKEDHRRVTGIKKGLRPLPEPQPSCARAGFFQIRANNQARRRRIVIMPRPKAPISSKAVDGSGMAAIATPVIAPGCAFTSDRSKATDKPRLPAASSM